jgi:RND family efflux transporter MFP subunit
MKHLSAIPLLLLLTLGACKEPEIPAAVIRPAQVWTVSDQATSSGVTYSGETKARVEADLAFRVGGKVIARNVDVGDVVSAGQVLASLDTTDLNLNTSSAKASLAAAEADFSNANTELARVSALHRQQFIGQAALDNAQAAHDAAAAKVAAAKAQLKLSGNQAGYTELRAEQAGIITQVTIEAGQVVAAGTPAARMAYEGEREIHIRVGETTAQTLQMGALTDIKLWSQPDKVFQGKVREIAPTTDATRSFLVKISLLNPPADLRLGVTADVSLASIHTSDSRWLPASALFQQEHKTAVWVVNADNKVTLQPITVSAFHEAGITVTGLPAGTKVIAAGVHKLSNGQTINPIPYDGKAGA